jgi:hypothetical protein
MPSVHLTPCSQMMWSSQTLLYAAAVYGGQVFEKCGAKGTRTPGLLDANQIFGVFLRRLASPDEASTCADRRRVSAHVARSRTPLALCLALLRHPSGLGDATCGARRFAPAASPQMAVTGFLSSRNQEMAGQSTSLGQMALARLSAEASWLVPPDTAETRVSASPRCVAELCLNGNQAAPLRGARPGVSTGLCPGRPARRTPGRPYPAACEFLSAPERMPAVLLSYPGNLVPQP